MQSLQTRDERGDLVAQTPDYPPFSIPALRPEDFSSLLLRMTMELLWPVKQFYIGRHKSMAAATGYSPSSARRLLYRGTFGMHPRAVKRLVAYLRSMADQLMQIAEAWESYLSTCDQAAVADRLLKGRVKKPKP